MSSKRRSNLRVRPKGAKGLPKSPNGTRRKTVSFACFNWQKRDLQDAAYDRKDPISVSRYLNMRHWENWLRSEDKRVEGKRKRRKKD